MPLRFLSPIHKAGRQVTVYLGDKLHAFGLDPVEGHVLSYLRSYAPCPVGELVRVFGHKPSTMTSILDRLEKRNLLMRKANPKDRRSLLVFLDDSGVDLADRIFSLLEDLEGRIGDRITDTDMEGFRAVMAAVGEVTDVRLREEERQ